MALVFPLASAHGAMSHPSMHTMRAACVSAGVGIVEKVGPGVSRVAVGDSVVMSYASCGGCANCSSGAPSYCSSHRLVRRAPTRPSGAPFSKLPVRTVLCFASQASASKPAWTNNTTPLLQ